MTEQKNDDACGASRSNAGLERRVGWWVVFDEPNDTGEIPEGFFINDERARMFCKEPGFLLHHLEPVYRLD